MDGWQTVQSWAMFIGVAAGLGYYYYWPDKRPEKPMPQQKEPKETKKDTRKPYRRQDHESTGASSISPEAASGQTSEGSKKRKAPAREVQRMAIETAADGNDGQEEIDMSTRQFAANLQRAREGIQVKASNKNEARVKTVKPKNSTAHELSFSSNSSQPDAEEDGLPAVSPALRASGIDDMLEPATAGPSALRITPSEKPTKEKVNKQPKNEVVETKKQRQNRRKAEERKQALLEEEKERKARGEQQRRAAREARGEPAKNGIAIAPAPVQNPWAEQNAAREAHLPVVDHTGSTVQLLDTLETESNSSSNQGISTAATSVNADAAPSRWAVDDDFAKAVEESELESGWNEVKSNKKTKKTSDSTGTATPVVVPPATNKAKTAAAAGNKPYGFQALHDEGERSGDIDSGDPSNWAA